MGGVIPFLSGLLLVTNIRITKDYWIIGGIPTSVWARTPAGVLTSPEVWMWSGCKVFQCSGPSFITPPVPPFCMTLQLTSCNCHPFPHTAVATPPCSHTRIPLFHPCLFSKARTGQLLPHPKLLWARVSQLPVHRQDKIKSHKFTLFPSGHLFGNSISSSFIPIPRPFSLDTKHII